MKHLEVRQKYSAARRIFNSLLGVSSGDETLRLMFDILLQIWWHVNLHCVPHNISQFSLLVCCRFMYSSSLNTPLRVVFSTLFSVFHLVMEHCVSCLLPNLRFCLWSTPLKAKPYSTFLYCYQTIVFLCIKSVSVCYIYASHSGPLSFKLFVSHLAGTLKWATRAPKMLLSCFLFLILLEMLAKQLLLESVVQSLVFNLMISTR